MVTVSVSSARRRNSFGPWEWVLRPLCDHCVSTVCPLSSCHNTYGSCNQTGIEGCFLRNVQNLLRGNIQQFPDMQIGVGTSPNNTFQRSNVTWFHSACHSIAYYHPICGTVHQNGSWTSFWVIFPQFTSINHRSSHYSPEPATTGPQTAQNYSPTCLKCLSTSNPTSTSL